VKIINSLSGVILYVAIILVVAMMLLTVSDVFLRYAFASPITGTTELTEFMMICLLLGMAPCALAGQQVRVDAVVRRLRPRVQAILDIILYIPGLGVVAILAWRGYEQSRRVLEYSANSTMLDIPKFPFYVVLIVSFIILFLAMVFLLIQRIAEAVKR
jgi:TRAP-type C4-dicarboxylate transport system permease small subunit